MKFKFLMDRTMAVSDIVAPQPIAGHPLSALALIGSIDLARPNPVTVNNAYAYLAANGLPSGFTSTPPVAGRPFSGWGLVGPNGAVPFKVTRVVHRITYGAHVEKGRGGVNLMLNNPMVIPAFNSNLIQTPAGTLFAPVNVTAGSAYGNGAQEFVIPLENSSFVDNQGNFSNVQGVTASYRLNKTNNGIGNVIVTCIETLPPSAIPGSGLDISWAGRFLGFVNQTVMYNQVEARFPSELIISTAEFISEWEVEVDDNLISQIQSQTGKIYAIMTPKIPQLILNAEIDAPNGVYLSIDGSSLLPNIGFTDCMVIDITTLQGTQAVVGIDYQSDQLRNFSNAPISANSAWSSTLTMGCSINAPNWDIVTAI